ncbi:uncharacterized protein LOC127007315 [Eriocheir sinensis]|uniref:uncharacterized protein LOC127007315 n=1 Tax=Eriocheir sinensis TaxID=95602 RepID=UPI0021C9C0BB|nr:uncharacterized protein LOC127007315 [Eriocheir sinensis]
MQGTALALTFLLLLLLVRSTSAANEGQLQVLSDVLSGPARGKPLTLHLDTTLPADVQRAVMGLEVVRRTPHLTLTLSLSDSRWQSMLGGSSFIFSKMLHVLLWFTPRPELLQSLWLYWKPRNLLLFSLGPSPGTDLLRHEALSGVENVALIGHLSAQADPRLDALWVHTVLPFSPGGVQLLGPWRREAFASWEALFPDRFPSFEGYTFHIATWFFDPPFLYNKPSAPDVGIGYYRHLLKAISSKLNFTYTLTREPPDLKWGVIENGSWVGCLGMVARKEKNFTLNGLFISKERVAYFEPSDIVGREHASVFMPSPMPVPEWLSIVRPFSPSTWASFVVVVVIAVVFMVSLVSVYSLTVIVIYCLLFKVCHALNILPK